MELKDFIAQTISQVMEGVREAQKLAEKVGGAVRSAPGRTKASA